MYIVWLPLLSLSILSSDVLDRRHHRHQWRRLNACRILFISERLLCYNVYTLKNPLLYKFTKVKLSAANAVAGAGACGWCSVLLLYHCWFGSTVKLTLLLLLLPIVSTI